MKKAMLIASLVYLGLTSCNNDANDGDATTDTTNLSSGVPPSSAPYGDTSRDVNNTGTQTNLSMRSDVDSMSNSNRPGDSTGGTDHGGGGGTGGRNKGKTSSQ